MVSIARQRLRLALGLLALVTVAFAQRAPEPSADQEGQLLGLIEREQVQNGPHSEGLIDPLSALAEFYQERGDEPFAVAAIERVLEVIRANDGLHSLEQAPLIRQLITLEESSGDAVVAWDLEQRLLTLARRHPDDLRTVPIFRDIAENRLAVLARLRAGESPPQIELGCYRGWPRNEGKDGGCRTGTTDDAVRAVVSDAQRNYADAITVMLKHELYGSDELRELEMGILRSMDHLPLQEGHRSYSLDGVRTQSEPWRSWLEVMGRLARLQVPNPGAVTLKPGVPQHGRGFDYLLARESLVRLFAYELAASAPLSDQIAAFLRIADWDLRASQNGLALDEYEQVYRLLRDRGARASIDEFFAPKTPIVLPSFSPSPLVSEETTSIGYIDVAFDITKYGESAHIAILDTTTNATDAQKDSLITLIKSSRFRPRASDGAPARASPVVVRYYLDD